MQYRSGIQHVVINYLSRLESGETGDGVPDEFPDVELFKTIVETTTDSTIVDEDKWPTKMHHFLSMGLPLEEIDWNERK